MAPRVLLRRKYLLRQRSIPQQIGSVGLPRNNLLQVEHAQLTAVAVGGDRNLYPRHLLAQVRLERNALKRALRLLRSLHDLLQHGLLVQKAPDFRHQRSNDLFPEYQRLPQGLVDPLLVAADDMVVDEERPRNAQRRAYGLLRHAVDGDEVRSTARLDHRSDLKLRRQRDHVVESILCILLPLRRVERVHEQPLLILQLLYLHLVSLKLVVLCHLDVVGVGVEAKVGSLLLLLRVARVTLLDDNRRV